MPSRERGQLEIARGVVAPLLGLAGRHRGVGVAEQRGDGAPQRFSGLVGVGLDRLVVAADRRQQQFGEAGLAA